MNVYLILSFISSLLFFQAMVIAWLLIKVTRIKEAFILFALSFSIFALFNFFQLSTTNVELVYIFDRIAAFGWMSFPITTLWLLYNMSNKGVRGIKEIMKFFLIPVALVVFIRFQYDPYSLKNFYFHEGVRFYSLNSASPWYYVFVVYMVLSAMACLYVIYKWKKHTQQNRQKLQGGVVIVGLVAFVVISIITNIIFPQFGYNKVGPLAHITVLPFAAALFYSLIFLSPQKALPEIVPKLITNYLREFVFYFDHQGGIYSVNRFVLKNLQYNLYEILRLPPEKIFSQADKLHQTIRELRQVQSAQEIRIEIFARAGLSIPVLAKIIRINDHFGNFIGAVLIGVDLRPKVALEQEVAQRTQNERLIIKARNDLEGLVEQRTRELFEANEKLSKEIQEKTRVEQQIVDDLQEKVRLVQEIHHRVKNNIQIIVSLTSMLTTHRDIDENAGLKLRRIADRIRSISAIHEDLYSSANLSKINFSDFIKKSTGEIYANKGASKTIIFRIKTTNEYLEIDRAIPCAIIYTELLTNIIETRFLPMENSNSASNPLGNVSIEFYKRSEEYTLIVSDNGIGAPNGKSKTGRLRPGLELVDMIVKNHLKGKLITQVAQGTSYVLKFSN